MGMGIFITHHARRQLFARCGFISEKNIDFHVREAFKSREKVPMRFAVKKILDDRQNKDGVIIYKKYRGHIFIFQDRGDVVLITVYK